MTIAQIAGSLRNNSTRAAIVCFALVLSMLMPTALFAQGTANLELSSSTKNAQAGHFQLSWSPAESEASAAQPDAVQDLEFILEEAKDAAFAGELREIYRGSDRATVFSGRSNGTYHFRVRSANGAWRSAVLSVRVTHHSATETIAYFSAGAIVFFATLLVMFRREVGP